MNHYESRSSAVTQVGRRRLAACGLVLVAALTGCGAGQLSQTAVQEPAVNGAKAIAGDPTSGIALRNIHMRTVQTTDYVQPGQPVELLFVAINESAKDKDRLVSITSTIGSVSVTGDPTIPAGGTLVVGTPDGQPTPLEATEAAASVQSKVSLTTPISNGLTYPFTFTFQRTGDVTVSVPISAGEAPRREAPKAVEAGAEADTGGHP